MIRKAIAEVLEGRSLSLVSSSELMEEIMDGGATSCQIASVVTALRIKGETVDEITGMASIMLERSIPVRGNHPLLDTCGMGGDKSGSINISTVAFLIAAGAGLRVAKHGNRAMSSSCGSADVLEALGVKIDQGQAEAEESIKKTGMCFMLATTFHPAMSRASAVRREIGVRTVFNILGPLTNPARPDFQVIGVPSLSLGEKTARVLYGMGSKHALVVHGNDNAMDEISLCGRSIVWEVSQEGGISSYELSPADFGFREEPPERVRGGTPEVNAAIIRGILRGERGAHRNIAVMNAGAALFVGGKAGDMVSGARVAEEVIDSGSAMEKLEELIDISNFRYRKSGQVEHFKENR